MINPSSRTNFLSPDQWKARAQAIQDRIKDWSLDELLRGKRADEEPHLGLGGGHGRGYDPNQPRVPAGHSDGGQWTKLGTHTQAFSSGIEHGHTPTFSRVSYAAAVDRAGAGPSVEVQRINGAGDGTNLAWRRYAELRGLSVEDERAVEEATQMLTNLLVKINGTISRVPGLTERLHGIHVHTAFAIAVKALRLPPHLGTLTLQVEQSFDQLGSTRYGQPGSIRTDVILRNAQGTIIAIYDVKTGDAEMRPSTEQKYREYTKVNPSVQLIILRARRVQR